MESSSLYLAALRNQTSAVFVVDDSDHVSDSTVDDTDNIVVDNAGEGSDYDVTIMKVIAFMLTIMVVTINWL